MIRDLDDAFAPLRGRSTKELGQLSRRFAIKFGLDIPDESFLMPDGDPKYSAYLNNLEGLLHEVIHLLLIPDGWRMYCRGDHTVDRLIHEDISRDPTGYRHVATEIETLAVTRYVMLQLDQLCPLDDLVRAARVNDFATCSDSTRRRYKQKWIDPCVPRQKGTLFTAYVRHVLELVPWHDCERCNDLRKKGRLAALLLSTYAIIDP